MQLITFFSICFSYPLNDAAETINEMGASIRRVMGGTSGILYCSYPVFVISFPLWSIGWATLARVGYTIGVTPPPSPAPPQSLVKAQFNTNSHQ